MYSQNRPRRDNRRRDYAGPTLRRGRFQGSRSYRDSGRRPQPGRGRGGRRTPSFDPSRFINTNPAEATPEVYQPKHTFATFGLNPKTVTVVAKLGMASPTPIQDQIIPEILAGRDVIGLAETGTGKTAAFLLPLIEKSLKNHQHQTLILAPTRELAIQISEELRRLAYGFRINYAICVGGVSIRPQIMALRRPNQFVIGTPGRVRDLINQRYLNLRNVSTVVLDEADRMLDMGFINDMRAILSLTPKERETLLFSATMSSDAKRLVNDFMRDPLTVSVKKTDVISSIEQDVVPFEHHTKFEKLLSLFGSAELRRVLIFGSMKHSVERLARQLTEAGIQSESIHGNKNQGQRQRALQKFKSGQVRVLVATDVAARGIHVDNVTHVINYDLPNTFEDYVHRIGRTGRAKKRGKALTFVPTFATRSR